jgi:antitoxin YefM
MDAIPYTTLRANLAGQMDRVCEDHAPLIVTRKASSSVVMISLDDYESLEETSYLLRSPKNARRLLASIADLDAGAGTVQELVE